MKDDKYYQIVLMLIYNSVRISELLDLKKENVHLEEQYFERTPHCCRHTCISMLADARVDQTTIKKIVGHAGAMTLTEKVYTHMDIGELVKAINLI